MAPEPTPVLTEALLRRFDVSGPRYTSYPTADRFTPAFSAVQLDAALAGMAAQRAPISLYVHIPFCESVCYYCACNKIVTRQHGRAQEYLQALEREIALLVARLGDGRSVSNLHLGGGTPTFLSDAELARLFAALRRGFMLRADAEVSVEVDPRSVDSLRLTHLKALGANRLSLGVQDFDADVQRAVHREQPFESVRALMQAAREIGFDSINLDLIYGLPRQSAASFARTIEQVITLRPDRIAVYAYAHLPQRFKPQRRIDAAALPTPDTKLAMQAGAIARLRASGYDDIGMDHFALPDDALAVARREGRLHRSFQGYGTAPEGDLLGLGVSAISRIGATYSQNAKTLPEYLGALRAGTLPVERGIALSTDDRLRRDVIMALMCQGRVDFDTIRAAHGVDLREYCAPELERAAALQSDGLLRIGADSLELSPLGWPFVRGIAMLFDQHLQAARRRASGGPPAGADAAAREAVVQFSRIL